MMTGMHQQLYLLSHQVALYFRLLLTSLCFAMNQNHPDVITQYYYYTGIRL